MEHRATLHRRPTGSRGTLVGDARGHTPCPPEAVSSDTIENLVYPSADSVRDAPSPTRGDYGPSVDSSTPVPQRGHPSPTTVPQKSASGGRGRETPLTPAAVAHWV